MTPEQATRDLDERIAGLWQAVEIFTRNRDPHGVMGMGAELQSLPRARQEVARIVGR